MFIQIKEAFFKKTIQWLKKNKVTSSKTVTSLNTNRQVIVSISIKPLIFSVTELK
jgi:hypothetical protein